MLGTLDPGPASRPSRNEGRGSTHPERFTEGAPRPARIRVGAIVECFFRLKRFGVCAMDGWIEPCRDVVSPWECDVTEHFTIAYYFDRVADAASALAESLGLRDVSRSVGRRFDVRFARELRAGASFHILSGAIALDERSVRLGHQIVDSADCEV